MPLDHPPESDSRGVPRAIPGVTEPQAGDVNAVISEEIVQLYLRAFGRGPTRARTYVQPQFVVCVLGDVLTVAERTLIDSDGSAEVEAARARINDSLDREYVGIVERQIGRAVLSHLARTRLPVEVAVHFFLFDDGSHGSDR